MKGLCNNAGAILVAIIAFASVPAPGKADDDAGLRTVKIISSIDGTEQKARFYVPEGGAPDKKGGSVPLLVVLHTWSGDYAQSKAYPKAQKWAMIAPDFRGPNKRPEACASKMAVQDVLDAVDYAKKNARIDESRIYLSGWSGGGHMSLMMVSKAPAIWAAVSVWVPVTDLSVFYETSGSYAKDLKAVCGGPPGTVAADTEYKARSPIHFLAAAKGVPIDINAGIHDGHKGAVLISQSLNAFNVLAEANGLKGRQISKSDIEVMTCDEKIPEPLAGETEKDPERKRAILFRRTAGPVRITVFEGGHEAEMGAAWKWLARQRKGEPADFETPKSEAGEHEDASEVQQVEK